MAVNSWTAAGRLASLTYSSSSKSSLANESPKLFRRDLCICSEGCLGDRAEEQEKVWGDGAFGSSLALSGYRFKARAAMDKT